MSQQLWDAGNYKGNLVEAVFGKSSTGKPQVVMTFDIDGNRKLVFAYLSDAAKERTFDDLEKMGWNGSTADPQFTNPNGVELYMKHDTYEGKTNEKWSISSGGFKPEPLATDDLKRIEAQFRNRKGSPAPSRSAPPPRSAPPARSAPPPRTPTNTEPKFGKDEAWDAFEKGGVSSPEAFNGAIEATEKARNKTEAEFTADDWKYVCELKDIPF